MKTPSMIDMKQTVMTPEVKSLVGTYLLARVLAETTREEVDKVHAVILQDIEIHANTHGRTERLYKMSDLYQSDDDTLCTTIYAEADKRLKAAGIKPQDMESDYCPALSAESDVIKIRNLIIEATARPLGIEIYKVEDRIKWTDLIISAIISAPDFVNPLTTIKKVKP